MRQFDRRRDGLVLEDVRDLQFLVDHQEKLQGKCNMPLEFASTEGGTRAYTRELYRVPVVATINNSTRNFQYLFSDDFISNPSNVCFLSFAGRPGEASVKTSWS